MKIPEVVLIEESHLEDFDYAGFRLYLEGKGPLPMFCWLEDYETFLARGRLPDCDCGHIQCVCAQARLHVKGCVYRLALTCAIPIECEHGFDVCPECDPCDCEKLKEKK